MEIVKQHKSAGGIQRYCVHDSKVTSTPMRFSAYLPPQAEYGPVPVVFFLSGLTCTEENVTTKAGFQRDAAALGLAVVAPDTSPRGLGLPGEDESYDFGSGAGFYVDATRAPWSENYRMYSYVTDELPDLIARELPVDRDRIGVFGHSMGGHGALVAAFRHPDRFKSVSAFAPDRSSERCPVGKEGANGVPRRRRCRLAPLRRHRARENDILSRSDLDRSGRGR